jgi:signal transduction histidine kinase/ActR/RegA family two-component response regulator
MTPDEVDYAAVFDALPAPFLVLTPELVIVGMNRARERVTGTRRADVVGRHLFEAFPDNPADPQASGVRHLRASLERVLATGEPHTMAVQKYDILDQQTGEFVERYWSPVNVPVLDEHGRVVLLLHRVEDVTVYIRERQLRRVEQERGEEALQTRLEDLEADLFNRAREIQEADRTLREVIARLETATAELQEQHRAKDRFSATLSHELRNPLAAVRAALDVLALDIAGNPVLAVLDRQTAALTRMTDDLLDAARGVTGRLTVQRRPLDLRALVEQVVADVGSTRGGPGRTIDLVLPDAAVPFDGDAVRLGQAVTNLIDNAWKYTPADAAVSIRLSVDDGNAELQVRDNGPGFDPTVAERLFEPFHRESDPQRQSPSGLGLGLAVVRAITQLHDGTVTAHSDGPGTGATFTMRLPLRDELPDGAPAMEPAATGSRATSAEPTPPVPLTPQRILIIDDNEDLARAYQSVLTTRGHEVTAVLSAREGLAQAQTAFDVILCDIALGEDIDGYEVARRLRGTPQHRQTRFVAVSGLGRDQDKSRALESGFDAHLTKPLDLGDLEQLLRRWSEDDPPSGPTGAIGGAEDETTDPDRG